MWKLIRGNAPYLGVAAFLVVFWGVVALVILR